MGRAVRSGVFETMASKLPKNEERLQTLRSTSQHGI